MSKGESTKKVREEKTYRRPREEFWDEFLDEELEEEDYYVSPAILNSLRVRKENW